MAHSRLPGAVDVRPGPTTQSPRSSRPLEDDHGVPVCRCAGAHGPDARRISDQVVLLTRVGVPNSRRIPIGWSYTAAAASWGALQRGEAIDDHRFVHVCMHELG